GASHRVSQTIRKGGPPRDDHFQPLMVAESGTSSTSTATKGPAPAIALGALLCRLPSSPAGGYPGPTRRSARIASGAAGAVETARAPPPPQPAHPPPAPARP